MFETLPPLTAEWPEPEWSRASVEGYYDDEGRAHLDYIVTFPEVTPGEFVPGSVIIEMGDILAEASDTPPNSIFHMAYAAQEGTVHYVTGFEVIRRELYADVYEIRNTQDGLKIKLIHDNKQDKKAFDGFQPMAGQKLFFGLRIPVSEQEVCNVNDENPSYPNLPSEGARLLTDCFETLKDFSTSTQVLTLPEGTLRTILGMSPRS